jgi:hypothetical protein
MEITGVARAENAATVAIIATACAAPVTICLGFALFRGIMSFDEYRAMQQQKQAGGRKLNPPE